MPATPNLQRFRDFIARFTALVDAGADEPRIFAEGSPLLSALVARDDWLPESAAQGIADGYRQHLLHCDGRERFSVVSFVWGPGVRTPIHDHTVWGMVGVMRGAELCHEYAPSSAARLAAGDAPLRKLGAHLCKPGDVDRVSPTVGDIHIVENALADRSSLSIHVYGANIGSVRRHVFSESGEAKPFVSGYSNAAVPNFWTP